MCLFCSTSSRMENKAMYLHTFNERENGSIFEEPFEGRNLSKLNLCEDGEYGLCVRLGLGGGGFEPGITNPESFWGRDMGAWIAQEEPQQFGPTQAKVSDPS